MAKIVKELIEYNFNQSNHTKNLLNFKQFTIDNIFRITKEKPEINQLTKIWVDYEMCEYELVKTPCGTSCEGQILTGNELFISANLKIKAEYVADKCLNSIHFTNTVIPICVYVTLEEGFINYANILPSLSIEDVYCEQINPKEVYINLVLMALVDIC